MEKIQLELGRCYEIIFSDGSSIRFKFIGAMENGFVMCQNIDTKDIFDFNTINPFQEVVQIDCP